MSETTIIRAQASADRIKERIKTATAKLVQEYGITPKLAVILVGDNPASEVYIAQKEKQAAYVGIDTLVYRMPVDTTPEQLFTRIDDLNNDPTVNGMILQLPLPLATAPVKLLAMQHIRADKDADCFHPQNIGRNFLQDSDLVPCTAYGVIQLLDDYNVEVKGKHVVVIGTSNIAGKPLAIELMNRNATVTTCNVFTKNIREITRTADILVVAVGRARYFDASYVSPGCVVIDVGIHKIKNLEYIPAIEQRVATIGLEAAATEYARDNNLPLNQALELVKMFSKEIVVCGDVDSHSMYGKVSMISAVPGGVGVLTVANLLHNTLVLTLQQHQLPLEYFGISRVR